MRAVKAVDYRTQVVGHRDFDFRMFAEAIFGNPDLQCNFGNAVLVAASDLRISHHPGEQLRLDRRRRIAGTRANGVRRPRLWWCLDGGQRPR